MLLNVVGGGFIYSFLGKGINTFYKENTFYNKKKFSHFIFYDIYFNKKKFYKNIFENKQINIANSGFKKEQINIVNNNFKKFFINTDKSQSIYSETKNNHKNYEKIFYKIFNGYKKKIFDYKQNLTNKKHYREESFFRKRSLYTNYTYNYNNNFKGYYEKMFFDNVYKKIYKDKYIKNLIEENSYTKLNGYKYFYNKKADRTFLYRDFEKIKRNDKKENTKEYKNIMREINNLKHNTIIERKTKELDLDHIYEKIKEKIFDEVFMMSGGLY